MNQSPIPLPPEFDLLCKQAALDDVFSTRPDLESDYDVAISSIICPQGFQPALDYDDIEYDLVQSVLDDHYIAYYNLAHKVVELCRTSI
jgi:hypothetical protein